MLKPNFNFYHMYFDLEIIVIISSGHVTVWIFPSFVLVDMKVLQE